MKVKKLLSDCVTRKTDTSLPIAALLAGLAVGAVVGILFAPESGADTRGRISDKAGDLAESMKDKFQSVKEKLGAETEKAVEVKDHIVDDIRKKTKEAADHIQGVKDEQLGNEGAPQNA